MTKLDGDARGGAALSIKEITGKPIKFLGTGEGLDKLETFRPEGLASRILGMGDIVGLMKDFEQVVDEKQAERDTKKLLRGQFTCEDFLDQLRMLQKVGSVKEIDEKFPSSATGAAGGRAESTTMRFTVMESIDPVDDAEGAPGAGHRRRQPRQAHRQGRGPQAGAGQGSAARFQMMHR